MVDPLCVRCVSKYFETLTDNSLCREKKKKKQTVGTAMTQFSKMTLHRRAKLLQTILPSFKVLSSIFISFKSLKCHGHVCVCVCVCVGKEYTDTHRSSFILILASDTHIYIFICVYIDRKYILTKFILANKKRRQKITCS